MRKLFLLFIEGFFIWGILGVLDGMTIACLSYRCIQLRIPVLVLSAVVLGFLYSNWDQVE
jgi:hypothetical protein